MTEYDCKNYNVFDVGIIKLDFVCCEHRSRIRILRIFFILKI